MVKLVSAAEMRAIQEEVLSKNLLTEQIITTTALNLVEIIERKYGYMAEGGALGLAGIGIKGDITLATLIALANKHWSVTAYIIGQRSKNDVLVSKLKEVNCSVIFEEDDLNHDQLSNFLGQHSIWFDGILSGDGRFSLEDRTYTILSHISTFNKSHPHVVAIDYPSGIDCASGEISPVVLPAEMTVAIGAVIYELLFPPTSKLVGEIRSVDFPILASTSSYQSVLSNWVDYNYVKRVFSQVRKGSNLCILGGSVLYPGSILLSGRAAFHVGVPNVTFAAPSVLYEVIAGHLPEAKWLLLPHEMGVLSQDAVALVSEELGEYSAILLGCGIGTENPTKEFINRLFETDKSLRKRGIGFVRTSHTHENVVPPALPPVVVDSDALSLITQSNSCWEECLPDGSVLLIVPKDLPEIMKTSEIPEKVDSVGLAKYYASKWKRSIVYISDDSLCIVASPDGRIAIVPVSISFLKSGTRYVLGGVIAGLLTQGIPDFQAAAVGTWIYAMAAISGIGRDGSSAGLIASDVEAKISDIIRSLE